MTTELKKALALKQFNGEEFFIIELEVNGDDKGQAFEGNKKEEREKFKLSGLEENEENDLVFQQWCNDNLIEVLPIDEDEERENYIVLTDEEADAKTSDYIKDSLWAFNAEFILSECQLDLSGSDSLRNMQEKSCEGANDFIYSLIDRTCGIDEFIQDAIRADGRGHFINSYDGNESEETIDGETFYIYRVN
jgi:hypothetical protein